MTATPIPVTTPPDTMPKNYAMRLRWAERIGDDRNAATLRWRKRNAEMPVECQCGAPATCRVRDGYPWVGTSGPYWWRCDEHASVPLDIPWGKNGPLTGQDRAACSWSTSHIGGPIEQCGCGTHVGEQR